MNEKAKKEEPKNSKEKLPTNKLWWWIATWFGSGLAPKASGTFGTIAALPFAFAIQISFDSLGLFIAAIIIFFIGWWASNEYMKYYPQNHDPKQIVVDEVAGVWLLLSVFQISSIATEPNKIELLLYWYLTAFILFRFFDVIKPWPISVADEKIKGGFGVMFDDILAAIYPILCLIIIFILYAPH